MFALISPDEQIADGVRVAEICAETFEVAEPMTWVECSQTDPLGLYAVELGGVWTIKPLPGPSAAEKALILKAQAQTELTASDVTVIRCVEHAVPVPAEWTAYRAALRSIISSGTGTLPTRPAYPTGT